MWPITTTTAIVTASPTTYIQVSVVSLKLRVLAWAAAQTATAVRGAMPTIVASRYADSGALVVETTKFSRANGEVGGTRARVRIQNVRQKPEPMRALRTASHLGCSSMIRRTRSPATRVLMTQAMTVAAVKPNMAAGQPIAKPNVHPPRMALA